MITKEMVLKSVAVHYDRKTFDCLWATRIVEDGVVIAETLSAQAYDATGVGAFEAAVGQAAGPLKRIFNWDDPSVLAKDVEERRAKRRALEG